MKLDYLPKMRLLDLWQWQPTPDWLNYPL